MDLTALSRTVDRGNASAVTAEAQRLIDNESGPSLGNSNPLFQPNTPWVNPTAGVVTLAARSAIPDRSRVTTAMYLRWVRCACAET